MFDNVIADLKWIISIHETADFAPIEEIELAIRVLKAAKESGDRIDIYHNSFRNAGEKISLDN